jgi:hypothetical protein
MNNFFDSFEADVVSNYKIFREERKKEIEELLRLETEKKQAKLEKQALKKLEMEQKAEEVKRIAEEAKTGKPAGKAPPKPAAKPGAKGGKDEKPLVDVPQLEVPKVTTFQSEMGNKYVRERTLAEIVTVIMSPPPEEDADSEKEEDIALLNPNSSQNKVSPRVASDLKGKIPDAKFGDPKKSIQPNISEPEIKDPVEEEAD